MLQSRDVRGQSKRQNHSLVVRPIAVTTYFGEMGVGVLLDRPFVEMSSLEVFDNTPKA